MRKNTDLSGKTKEELKEIAKGLGIEKISLLKKDELIEAITKEVSEVDIAPKKRQRPQEAVEVCGVLDVMADGFGFLRIDGYKPSETDVYVAADSPSTEKRVSTALWTSCCNSQKS